MSRTSLVPPLCMIECWTLMWCDHCNVEHTDMLTSNKWKTPSMYSSVHTWKYLSIISISSFLSPSLISCINIFLNIHKNEWIIGPENINPHPSWGPALTFWVLPRIQCTEHVHEGLAGGNRTKVLIPLPGSSLLFHPSMLLIPIVCILKNLEFITNVRLLGPHISCIHSHSPVIPNGTTTIC